MNVFAKFDEIPSMTLQDIKETKRYGHTLVRSQYTCTLPQTQFAGGITSAKNLCIGAEIRKMIM